MILQCNGDVCKRMLSKIMLAYMRVKKMYDTYKIHLTFNRGKLCLETTMEGLHHDKFFAIDNQ